jgi:hypothetical protein
MMPGYQAPQLRRHRSGLRLCGNNSRGLVNPDSRLCGCATDLPPRLTLAALWAAGSSATAARGLRGSKDRRGNLPSLASHENARVWSTSISTNIGPLRRWSGVFGCGRGVPHTSLAFVPSLVRPFRMDRFAHSPREDPDYECREPQRQSEKYDLRTGLRPV